MAKKPASKKRDSGQRGAESESDIARRIWLAGIGAYGRAVSDAQDSLSRVGIETSKLFDDLVKRGEELEDRIESRGRELADRVRNVPALSFQDRIKDMREKLKLRPSSTDDDRLSAIEERLDRIERMLNASPVAKVSENRTVKRRSAVKRAAPEQ